MENNTNNVKKTQDKVKKTDKNNDSNKKNKLTEEENSNTHSQKTSPKDQNTQDQVEKIIDTERIPNKEESIFANLCGNTSNNKTDNKKTLDEKLNNYFDSKEIKKELGDIGFPKNKFGNITKKLKEYLKRYTEEKIDLDKLKVRFHSYFEEVKSINKDNISKNDQIRIGIDAIKNKILSSIAAEEVNQTVITFGENDEQDNGDKSFIDIPLLDLSAINNPDSEENQLLNNLQNTTEIIKDVSEKFDKIEEGGLKTKTNITELLDEFAQQISDGDVNRLKIQTYFKIYESKLGYNISPTTEKLIIDLVLETEKYIESVKQIVKDYQMSEDTKAIILEAIDRSTSKESLEENIGKFEEGKKILELMQKEQVKDEGVYSKMMSKANKVYNKAYNKYYGYTNLSEQQIDEITKHVKMNSSTFDDINDMEEYVKTKGHTVESSLNTNLSEMYQSTQTQLHEVENEAKDATIDEFNPCNNVYCYATFAVVAILFGIQFMNETEVFHGFGPSGH